MPLYSFYCEKCDKEFECLYFTKDEPVKCKCGKVAKKVMTAPGMFNIKGFNADNGYSTPKE